MASASYPFLGGGGGVPIYANLAAFPSASGAGNGALAIALDTDILYISNGTIWEVLADPAVGPNAITQLHGDGSATGPGNVALTLATVNSNVGTFGDASHVSQVTANGKGLTTAASSVAIQIAESQVTNLTTDLASKVPNTRVINTTSPLTGGGALSSDLTLAVTSGNLTDAGTDGITITGGTAAVLGSGTSISQHISDSTHNGYLSSTDWSTFNGKQSALTIGNLTDAGTDGITVSGGTGAIIGSGTSLSQHVADTTHNGYLSSADWNTFNGKQSSTLTNTHLLVGNGSNVATDVAASGDLTLANTGAFTFNTVNSNVGTFGDGTHVGQFTVNAKGLITAASSVAITSTLMNGNVRGSEGGGTVTLTNADNQTQTFNLTSAETVKLPTTGIAKGDIWVMNNPNAFVLTIQSSGANTIIKSLGARAILQANVATPTAAADWTVLEHTILYGRTWTAFTPTINGLGTVTGTKFAWMRTGINNLSIIGRLINGTVSGSGNAELVLPVSLTLDTTNLQDLEDDFGLYHGKSTGGSTNIFNTNFSGCLIYSNSNGTDRLVFAGDVASNTFQLEAPTSIFGNNVHVNLNLFNIPISQWSET